MSSWREGKLRDIISSNNKSIDKNYEFENIQYLDTGSITNNKIDGFQEFKISEAPSRAKRLVFLVSNVLVGNAYYNTNNKNNYAFPSPELGNERKVT